MIYENDAENETPC